MAIQNYETGDRVWGIFGGGPGTIVNVTTHWTGKPLVWVKWDDWGNTTHTNPDMLNPEA